MPKTTCTYWNPLSPEHHHDWQPIEGRLCDAAFDRWLTKGDYANQFGTVVTHAILSWPHAMPRETAPPQGE